MKDLGTVRPGSTIYIEFDSFGASGESLTLTGLAATDVEVYKDGGTTQRASDNGYTLLDTDGIDFDGITGIHGLSINLADNSTAGFWAAGSHYRVVISSVTINSQTVSFTAATFRIGYPDAIINTTIATLSSQTSFTLTSGPAEDDALNGSIVVIHDVASAVQLGYAVISDYTGSTKTVTLTAGTTFTAAAADNISIFPPANAAYGGAVAYSTTRGLAGTALPNAAAEAAGGLYTRGTGAGQIAQDSNGTARVLLGDGAHGGTAAVLTLERIIAVSTTSGEPGLKVTGNGSGAGAIFTGGATGNGVAVVAAGNTAMLVQATSGNNIGLRVLGAGNQYAISAEGGLTGSGIYVEGGSGSNTDAIALVGQGTGKAINATGPVSVSGAVTFASTFTVSGATTLTGAVTASNASNNIVGIDVAKISGDATAADNAEAFFDGTGYAGTNNVIPTVTTTTTATNVTTVNGLAANVITAASIAADAIGASELAADAATEIATAVWALATRTLTAGTNIDGSTFTAIPWNASWDAEVQSEVDDALVAQNLDHLVKSAVDTDFATTVHLNSVIGHLADNGTTATYDRTTDSQEAIRDRGDAAWITATGFSTHSAADVWAVGTRVLTAGTNIQLPSNGLANISTWTAAITGNITGNLSGSVGSVTGNVGGNVTGSVGSISGISFPSNFAALGINASGHVSRVTLTDTLTTYTGNTVQTGDAYGALTSAVPDSVPADGSRPTVQQAVRMILQALTEGGISGTSWTIKKEDGSTTLMTVTLDSSTTPTSKTRSG